MLILSTLILNLTQKRRYHSSLMESVRVRSFNPVPNRFKRRYRCSLIYAHSGCRCRRDGHGGEGRCCIFQSRASPPPVSLILTPRVHVERPSPPALPTSFVETLRCSDRSSLLFCEGTHSEIRKETHRRLPRETSQKATCHLVESFQFPPCVPTMQLIASRCDGD